MWKTTYTFWRFPFDRVIIEKRTFIVFLNGHDNPVHFLLLWKIIETKNINRLSHTRRVN